MDSDIKLLLIDRTIFKDRIESNLREKGVFVEAYKIKKGDIISFLEENFKIKENTAVEIERKCQDSFVWAAFFAEFYREKGRIDELRKVLINRTEKYIRDLEIRATGMTIEDVKKILSLLSLVTPVKWKEDKKYFEEIFEDDLPEYEYEHFKRIISLAGETNILLVSDGEYAIKPDPVADFLRTDFIRDKRFPRLLNSLLPYMPLRISYNIGVIPRFTAEIEEVFRVLGNIWVKLNRIKGQTPEYFSALVLFTGDFAHLPFFDINEANMSLWIESYKDIRRAHPEKEVRENLAKGLVNATSDYGRAEKFEKMEERLQELRKLHDAHPEEKEVRGNLAKGLFNATNYLGDMAGGYENLFLLFVLRFDLPDDSNRERFIKIIEDLLIKETIKIVEDKYKEGEEHLAEFIDWMKAEIENQTELVLLLDKISEKLDVKVQKKLWALLT